MFNISALSPFWTMSSAQRCRRHQENSKKPKQKIIRTFRGKSYLNFIEIKLSPTTPELSADLTVRSCFTSLNFLDLVTAKHNSLDFYSVTQLFNFQHVVLPRFGCDSELETAGRRRGRRRVCGGGEAPRGAGGRRRCDGRNRRSSRSRWRRRRRRAVRPSPRVPVPGCGAGDAPGGGLGRAPAGGPCAGVGGGVCAVFCVVGGGTRRCAQRRVVAPVFAHLRPAADARGSVGGCVAAVCHVPRHGGAAEGAVLRRWPVGRLQGERRERVSGGGKGKFRHKPACAGFAPAAQPFGVAVHALGVYLCVVCIGGCNAPVRPLS